MQVQVGDVQKAFTAIGGKENPVKAVGSLFGFSGNELDAGIPTWAWILVGVAAGIYLGKKASDKGIL